MQMANHNHSHLPKSGSVYGHPLSEVSSLDDYIFQASNEIHNGPDFDNAFTQNINATNFSTRGFLMYF